MIQLQVCVCLCHIDARSVCVFAFPLRASYFPATSQTHTHTHPNVLDVLMLLEILARLLLPRITPSATAPSNPNENSCYILNSQEDCLTIIFSLLSASYSYLTLRCQIQIHFSEKKVHSKIPMKQENALNPANMRTVLVLQFNGATVLFR